MTDALLDTDVLHKGARYGLVASMLQSVPLGIAGYHMLGAARFMIVKKLWKKPPLRGAAAAIAQFEADTAVINVLEPTPEEVAYSASLELTAQQLNVPLDQGESLLCAVLTLRTYGYLLTGDKRAIGAIRSLLEHRDDLAIANNLVSLEQLIYWLIDHVGLDAVRTAICAERDADRALAACFSCTAATVAIEGCRAGLVSYIEHMRGIAPTVLLAAP